MPMRELSIKERRRIKTLTDRSVEYALIHLLSGEKELSYSTHDMPRCARGELLLAQALSIVQPFIGSRV